MKKQKMNVTKKICWKSLFAKAVESGIRKSIELAILALAIGIAYKTVLVAVPAYAVSASAAKLIKTSFMGA